MSGLASERSHQLWLTLEDGAGKIFIIITVSGPTGEPTPTIFYSYNTQHIEEGKLQKRRQRSSLLVGGYVQYLNTANNYSYLAARLI